jgi:hypothetical protein
MLHSVWRHLKRDWTRTSRRPGRASTRRPTLEALEDRLALSSATQLGSTLNITVDPGTPSNVRPIGMVVDGTDHTKLDVFDTGVLLGKFTISSISNVNVTVAGNDAIKVNDTNGMPFANGTVISLTGAGTNSSLNLVGSKPLNFNGNEIYFAGNATVPSGLSLGIGAPQFTFNSAISSVTDDLSASQLIVEAKGQAVSLVGSNGLTETLKGLAGSGGGGSTLTFRGKGSAILQLESANATATLNAPAGAIGEQFFQVEVSGQNDTVTINETPSNVTTSVIVSFGPGAIVNLAGNSGPVRINGDGTTSVRLGSNPAHENTSVTSGIKNNVFVEAAQNLLIFDGGNVTTPEQVRVTETTISGSGLFGNNAVTVTYVDNPVDIFTGQLANIYTVAASQPGASFSSSVGILDEHLNAAGLNVHVDVDSGSNLSLLLADANPSFNGFLGIAAVNGTFNPTSPTLPDGTEDVNFTSGFGSHIDYSGFGNVFLS